MTRSFHCMIAAACAAAAFAIPPALGAEEGAGPAGPEGSRVAPGAERGRFHRKDGTSPEGQYIDQWLDALKKRNPEEFERMRRLREEDPEAFRRHLHQKLQDLRQRGNGLQDRPGVLAALNGLSPEDREWVMQRLQQPPFHGGYNGFAAGPGRDRMGLPDFKRVTSPEIVQGEERATELAARCRAAAAGAEKDALQAELRETLARLFDLRETARAEQYRQIEEKFARIKKQLDEHMSDRDAIIDGRLREMLEGGPSNRPAFPQRRGSE